MNDITGWLRTQVTESDPHDPLERIALHHMGANTRIGAELAAYRLPDAPADEWIELRARELGQYAQEDAMGLGGTQRYVVLTYTRDEPTKPKARRPFRVNGDMDSDELSSEPATAQGLTALLMRHLEGKERTTTTAMAHIMAVFESRLDTLSKENEDLRTERMKMLDVYENMMSHVHDRQLATDKHSAQVSLLKSSAEKLGTFVPTLVNEMTGRKLLPEPSEAQAIARFARSITGDQLTELAETLDPGQLDDLLPLLKQYAPPEPEAEKDNGDGHANTQPEN